MADWFSKFLREQNGEAPVAKADEEALQYEKPGKLNRFIPDKKTPVNTREKIDYVTSSTQKEAEPNQQLLTILKNKRQEWAKELNLPTFYVFSNSTLESIAYYFPIDKESLSRIKGLGKAKLERYGDGIIEIITKFLSDNKDLAPLEVPVTSKTKKTSKVPKNAVALKEAEKEIEVEVEDDEVIKYIKELIKNGENVFVTGSAGTGKSFILNKLKKEFNFEVTSTTGMAAVNVGGQTIHAWAGVGICRFPLNSTIQNILKKSNLTKRIRNTKILAIDEISMLDAATFDYINNVLKAVRASNEAFGGLQVVLFGDFFQLPPVERENGFCFESAAWKELNLKNVLLKKIYRQEDSRFAKILNEIRQNNFENDDFRVFYRRNNIEVPPEKEILHIFATNEAADNYNRQKFDALKENIQILDACDILMKNEEPDKIIESEEDLNGLSERKRAAWETLDKYCKASSRLELKKNCRVMLLKNIDFEEGLINGSCGVVKGFEDDAVLVKFDNGAFKGIRQYEFDYMKDGKLAARRVQYPLRLAYGITIHKSQGMTLDEVFIDFERIFEYGQAYVALSRVKSLEGLYLRSFAPRKIMANPKIVEFYKQLEDEAAFHNASYRD